MIKFSNQNLNKENLLYNNILLLSRNKLLYTKFNLSDTFQNRINLIFIHISFLFVKINQENQKKIYKVFYQNMFDLIFRKIELNLREIGFGDTIVNKNMKFLVKTFYNILLNCENFNQKTSEFKNSFLRKYLEYKDAQNDKNTEGLIDYFDKFNSFCLDLSTDSVLKGDLNFNYK